MFRKETIWATTAYATSQDNGVVNRDFYELISPLEYTSNFSSGGLRKEHAKFLRTVGQVAVMPRLDLSGTGTPPENDTEVQWKAAIFVASENRLEESFTLDPTQFDIAFNPSTFATFCRDWSVLHVMWFHNYVTAVNPAIVNAATSWIPATGQLGAPEERWDVKVKRKLTTDDGVWLLVNSQAANSNAAFEVGVAFTDVESRVLFSD